MDRTPGHSRTSSVNSHSHFHHSAAASSRYILAGMSSPSLEPPSAPFAGRRESTRSFSSGDIPLLNNSPSLSINYLPSKFSSSVVGRRKRNGKGAGGYMVPKQGGGREAFKSNEARMPGEGDDDYDGVEVFGNKEGGRTKPKARWNRFKWCLFLSNLLFSAYSLAGLIACLLIWFNVWTHADIIRVGNTTELIISTTVASLAVLTSVIGWSGIILNNRAFLAWYSFLLWICFALLVTPGYITYKKRTFNLEGKINSQWSRSLGLSGRLRIQNQLGCCGYFNPFVEATVSQTCFARSVLPGCKGPYLRFERMVLERWYTAAFSAVPAQLIVMITALLCSNHVTYRFGKGMMPKAYRLNMNSMAVIMDNYASNSSIVFSRQVWNVM
ncbi:uncharacterized protein PHACADRAFT_169009 [Phanerochaete carnosa HHB-10118-sp]|uniref:Tetraspanin Tsp2 family n=1 Tax=Phanerochaete carnosa (strain HHB-10118-sp) TaxID=650164 RepID=K5WQN1_PHACS|nr:uncharacterized protein PHACADRAFT_169009 [Phanerochaete carnosa HHB-10118-sp]EKM61559.1 hypothetical protein PHACADRAFT_169009 [Phanerochaete carnosa HHB-10118-sp]